jgi:hypothetical protein
MFQIEVIPVIELPTRNWENAGNLPMHPYGQLALEWDAYWDNLQKVSGYKHHYKRISQGQCFYRINQFTDLDDLKLIIDRHLRPGSDEEVIRIEKIGPLFGGFVLKINNEFKLYPQCCCDLGDFENWTSILNDSYKSQYLFSSGHPSPKVIKKDGEVTFICKDNTGEVFSPNTDEEIIIQFEPLRMALEKTKIEMGNLASRINHLSINYGVEKAAYYLVGKI